MEFFLEMLFTAVVGLLFSFLVANLVSVAMAGNVDGGGNDPTLDQAAMPEITSGDGFVTEEIRFGTGADQVDELKEAAMENGKVHDQGEDVAVRFVEAESSAAFSPENVLAKEMVVSGQDDKRRGTGAEPEESMFLTTEAESSVSVSPENVETEEILIRGQEESEEGGDVSVAESEVEESNTTEWKTEEESESMEEASKETEELSIEEDDDWEGIERSELEKAFAAVSKCLEESEKAEEIGVEAKLRLYGLHKIATEGSCRETQPMSVMVSARAKWNAWQVLGNMSQEEAMEQYLALISNEIPSLMNISHTVGKMPEMETSAVLLPTSGVLEDPTTLDTLAVASVKNGEMLI